MAIIERSVVVEAPVEFVFRECEGIEPEAMFRAFGGGSLELAEASQFNRIVWIDGQPGDAASLTIGVQPIDGDDASANMTWEFRLPGRSAEELRRTSVNLELELQAMRGGIERAWVASRESAT